MRTACVVILLGGSLGAQSLVEYSGAAAGGTAGGVAGKKVSDGLTSIFNKLDKAAGRAAAADKPAAKDTNAPLFDVGPGVPHSHATAPSAPPATMAAAPAAASAKAARVEPGSVPPPPPVRKFAVRRSAPAPRVEAEPMPEPIAPPPPPVATAADLRTIVVGSRRSELAKLGLPAARITMYDDGHLIEVFRYMSNDTRIGVVRLSDGKVSSVQVN